MLASTGAVLFSSSEAGVAVSWFLPCFDGNLKLQVSCLLLQDCLFFSSVVSLSTKSTNENISLLSLRN